MPEDPKTTPTTDQQQVTQPPEHMVPKSRLDEVIAERQKLAEKLAQVEADKKAETEKQLAEQSRYKELAETRGADLVKAQTEAAKVATYEKTLGDLLASQVESIPEDKRGLVPDELTTQQKLAWIAKNAMILKAPAAFDIAAGRQGGGAPQGKPILTSEEAEIAHRFGMSDKEYAANK